MNILIFAGTKNGRELISDLADLGHTIFPSSASEYGASLLTTSDKIIPTVGKKNIEEIKEFITQNNIDYVIDSTHPYAIEVSQNILIACSLLNIKPIRFERKATIPPNIGRHFESMTQVCNYLKGKEGNVLFTTGVKDVPLITNIIDKNRTFFRVLKVESSRKIILECDIPSTNVIYKNPPFYLNDNIKHISDFKIKYVVTKDSGDEGNVSDKLLAVNETNTALLVIDRPQIEFEITFFLSKDLKKYIGV